MIANILDILDFLDLYDLQNYVYTKKYYEETQFYLKKKRNFIDSNYGNDIKSVFTKDLIFYPFMKFLPHFIDEINYVSKIFPSDTEHPISLAICNKNRPFIVIKYIQTKIYVDDAIYEVKTCVLFKHIYNQYKVGSLWSITSPYEYDDGIESNDQAREYFIFGKNHSITNKRICKLLRGEDVTLTLNTMNGIYNRNYKIYKIERPDITNQVNLCCTFNLFTKKKNY